MMTVYGRATSSNVHLGLEHARVAYGHAMVDGTALQAEGA